jgi:hypothetical protein
MRVALAATAVMNLVGAAVFAPLTTLAHELGGFPTAVHPLYAWTVAEFIGAFGIGYGWCAWRGDAPRLFIALGAGGKLAFFATVAAFVAVGELPVQAASFASADLWFGLAFLFWLLR